MQCNTSSSDTLEEEEEEKVGKECSGIEVGYEKLDSSVCLQCGGKIWDLYLVFCPFFFLKRRKKPHKERQCVYLFVYGLRGCNNAECWPPGLGVWIRYQPAC